MPSDPPPVSSAVVTIFQRQTSDPEISVVDAEMRKEVVDMGEEQEVEWHTVVEVCDFPEAAEVLFEAVSCSAALDEGPRKAPQKQARTHTFDPVGHSLCIVHQESFDIPNIVSIVRNIERVGTFRRLQ
jgi:hypothetical protein